MSDGGRNGAAAEVVGIVKRYPRSPVNALDGVSFHVDRGEIFGLLGPNGAGKTTTVGILTTLVRPTSGAAYVGGVDVVADPVSARRQLAVIPQRSNLDRSLSIRDNLIFHAAYHGLPAAERGARADALLEQFGLLDRARTKPDFFSGGQAQRVMIARALMHAPRVLFLDEPTTGLDPAARLFVWDRIRELKADGVTFVLTTHDMDEAAMLADRVGVIDRGNLLALNTPDALVRALPGARTIELTLGGASADGIADELAALPAVERVERLPLADDDDARIRLRLYVTGDAPELVAPVAGIVDRRGLTLADLHVALPTLEDVFIELTGRTLR